MQTYAHPISGEKIEGVRLHPGRTIKRDDKYDSSDGKWRTADSVAGGPVPPGDHVTWVRQPGPLSDNAHALLGYLASNPWRAQSCIGERGGSYYVIPSPSFNWDGRFDIHSQRVEHPECIEELLDHGYLVVDQHAVRNAQSDHAMVGDDHQNRVYVLTHEGRKAHAN